MADRLEQEPPAERNAPEYFSIAAGDLSLADGHRLLLHCVAPRPIAFVSTLSAEGERNLAPFSYFMAGGANPPSVVISPLLDRNGQRKDTHSNIEATGEFVVSAVTYAMSERMNQASAEYPHGVDEWTMAGFTPIASRCVAPPRVQESPFAIECKLFRVVPHGDGPLSANYIIGEVVWFHVARSVMSGDSVDARLVDYLSRMGADWYGRSNAVSMFEMSRPSRVEKSPAG